MTPADRLVDNRLGGSLVSLPNATDELSPDTLQRERRALLRQLRELEGGREHRRQVQEAETFRAIRQNPNPPPGVLTNTGVHQIDITQGVRVNWMHPDLIPIFRNRPLAELQRFRGRGSSRTTVVAGRVDQILDPVFAYAVVQFVLRIKRSPFNISALYSAGFLRHPKSLRDPHPGGQALDLTGYHVGPLFTSGTHVHVIHLRSGRPAGDRTSDNRENLRGSPSDWFNITDRIGSITYRDFMRQIANVFPEYFGSVTGPGENAEHMNHFHLQLRGYHGPPNEQRNWPAV